MFQKFRKNKLSKREYIGKSSNNIPLQETLNNYTKKMEIIHAKQKEEDFLLIDTNEKEKRAMTAFECKREFHLGNKESGIEEKRTDFYKVFFPESTMQRFPTFSEQRPNTSENHFRKKFTIKDLE